VSGRDVIAQAQSGTGKTATFSISILQSIDTSLRETQALVMSPTRYDCNQIIILNQFFIYYFSCSSSELAIQIQKVILALGDYMNIQCHACVGGTSIGEDIRKLDYGQHVVSGTPGRLETFPVMLFLSSLSFLSLLFSLFLLLSSSFFFLLFLSLPQHS